MGHQPSRQCSLQPHRRIALDERGARKLTRLGYQVLHLDEALAMQRPSVVVERIREAIAVAQSRSLCTI